MRWKTREDITNNWHVGAFVGHLRKPTEDSREDYEKQRRKSSCSFKCLSYSTVRIELGGKKYNVTAKKELVPHTVAYQETKSVMILEEKQTTV